MCIANTDSEIRKRSESLDLINRDRWLKDFSDELLELALLKRAL